MPQINYRKPPNTGNAELDRYLLEVHEKVFGIVPGGSGSLDSTNVNFSVPVADAVSQASTAHSAMAGGHALLKQASNVTNVNSSAVSVDSSDASAGAASTVSVATADADATYGTEERDLINEIKADVNTLVADLNTLVTAYGGVRTLANEIKADVNTLKTDLNNSITKVNSLLANMRTANQLV